MTHILLADDNAATRSALELFLATRLATHEINAAVDWGCLLARVNEAKPSVVLLDWELPGCALQEGLSAVRRLAPDARLIAMSARPEACQDALLAGVDAVILKSEPPEKVLETVKLFLEDA